MRYKVYYDKDGYFIFDYLLDKRTLMNPTLEGALTYTFHSVSFLLFEPNDYKIFCEVNDLSELEIKYPEEFL